MTVRDEVLEAARSLEQAGRVPCTPGDVVAEMGRRGTSYAESSIRTHVVSRMCPDAPPNFSARYADLERVGPGLYRLAPTAGGPLVPGL